MRFRLLFALLLFLAGHSGASRAQLLRNEGDRQMERFRINRSLYFNYDLFRFASDSSDSVQLFSVVSFVNDLLQFVKKADSLYQARFELTFTVLDSQKNLVYTKTFKRTLQAKTFAVTNSKSAAHSYWCRLVLSPGKYRFRLELTDLEIRKSLRREKEISLPEYFSAPVSLSDPVLLVLRARPEAVAPQPLDRSITPPYPFRPGNFLLTPFPVGAEKIQYFRLLQKTEFYFEIYHKGAPEDTVQLSFRLINAANRVLLQERKALFPGKKRRIGQRYVLDLSPFKPGMYVFQIQASTGGTTRTKQIHLFHTRETRATATDTSRLDEFGPLRYIVDENTYKSWQKLPAAARDSLVRIFWKKRDPRPETPEDELRQEFLRRVRFANANFISLAQNRPGWQTDQGKVYIVYGPPKEIVHPAIERGNYQHEIWIYEVHGKELQFIFRFDPEKGEYRLLRAER